MYCLNKVMGYELLLMKQSDLSHYHQNLFSLLIPILFLVSNLVQGIRQFGTDLAMIKELFPNLTRQQVKFKYKKEERQNPLRLSEALASRAKGKWFSISL